MKHPRQNKFNTQENDPPAGEWMKQRVIFIALTLLITVANAQDKSQLKIYCDKSQSTISYSMRHPLHSWKGESYAVNSVILTDENRSEISQVAVSVKISTFDSGNANRDSHAMEVTEALLYPSVSFISTNIKEMGDKLDVTGTLKFHGISQTISFEAGKSILDNKVKILGNFSLLLTQFNIEPPSLLGIATDDEFEVSFELFY